MNLIQQLWDRLIRLVEREKWAYVKMFTIDNVKSRSRDGQIFIHCYESSTGNRKINISSTFSDIDQKMIDKFVISSKLYQEKIVRWLYGRYDPDILKYSEISQEDTANALRGKLG